MSTLIGLHPLMAAEYIVDTRSDLYTPMSCPPYVVRQIDRNEAVHQCYAKGDGLPARNPLENT